MLEGELGVTIFVSDLRRSVEFYSETLGFEFKGVWDDDAGEVVRDLDAVEDAVYVEVYIGDAGVGLHADSEFEPGRTRIKPSFTIDDVDALYERVTDQGAEATEPEDQDWGMRMFTVTDPDGHELDFLGPTEE